MRLKSPFPLLIHLLTTDLSGVLVLPIVSVGSYWLLLLHP